MKPVKENFYLCGMHRIYGTLAATAILGLGLGLSACSSDKVAGGGPSGTEAGNAITAQILTADAKPAAMAKVKLIDRESLDAVGAFTAEADQNGDVSFDNVPKGSYILEARLDGNAMQKDVKVDNKTLDLGSDTLVKTVSVSGNIGNSANGTIKIRGIDHSAKVVEGEFTVDSLPAGNLSLVFIPDEKIKDTTSTYVTVGAGESAKTSTFAEEKKFLLLDDFQDNNYQHRFMPAKTYNGGWWYLAYEHRNTKIDSMGVKNNFLLETEADGNIAGHVSARYYAPVVDSSNNLDQYPDGNIYPWATVGVLIGYNDKDSVNNISSVDTISFRVKGEGSFKFKITKEKNSGSAETIIRDSGPLKEDWDTIYVSLENIPKKDLEDVYQMVWQLEAVPAEDDGTGVKGTVDFWIDDVKLIGGDRVNIWVH